MQPYSFFGSQTKKLACCRPYSIAVHKVCRSTINLLHNVTAFFLVLHHQDSITGSTQTHRALSIQMIFSSCNTLGLFDRTSTRREPFLLNQPGHLKTHIMRFERGIVHWRRCVDLRSPMSTSKIYIRRRPSQAVSCPQQDYSSLLLVF